MFGIPLFETLLKNILRWTSTINDLRVINVRGIFLISGVQARVFNTARRCLKERGIYSDDRNKLNKTNMLLAKISREFKNGGVSTPTLLICLGHPYCSFNSQQRSQNPRSMFIVLLSLVYPYFECDIEQDQMKYTNPG